MAKENSASRSWFAVFNNPNEHGYNGSPEEIIEQLKQEWLDGSPTRTGAWLYCVSADGLNHVHMVLEDVKPMKWGAVKKSYALGMHFEPTRGTKKEAQDYIKKVGKYEEKGETILCDTYHGEIKGNQGRRNDLHHLYDMISEGFSNAEILMENPDYIKQLTKLDLVRNTILSEQFKNKRRDMHVEFWYGPPGTGKSSGVRDLYGDDKIYVVTDYRHPFDSYSGQDVLFFDDFDPDRIRINDLLKWLDIYPLELPCRFNNKTACYTKVYFSSNKSLDEIYRWQRINEPMIYEALLRRIHCIKEFTGFGESHYIKQNDFVFVSPEEQKKLDEMFGGLYG